MSHHARNKGAELDRAFLFTVRKATLAKNVDLLTKLMKSHRKAPEWKIITIQRALKACL